MRQRRPVGTITRKGVVNVGHSQNSDRERNGPAEKAIRVAAAIEPLVMPADQGNCVADRMQRLHDAGTFNGMLLDNGALLVGQRAGLVEYRIWNMDLA